MNTSEIIVAIQQQSHKLRSLEEHILSDCHYYQETSELLDTHAEHREPASFPLGAASFAESLFGYLPTLANIATGHQPSQGYCCSCNSFT